MIRHSLEDIRRLATTDLDTFAGIVMPEAALYLFPEFYKGLWTMCIKCLIELNPDNKLFKLLLVLPRGHAKTTFVKLLTSYAIIHRLCNFAMVLCAADVNATNFVKDICDMLAHPNVLKLYGDWQQGLIEDNSQQKISNFMGRRVQLSAFSILSGEIRGTNRNQVRPDLIIFDDVQTKADSESAPLSDKKLDAVIGTAIPAASPHRCGVIYISNSYPVNCIATKLAESGEFITLKTGAILANGQPLWPELHSLASLRSSFRLMCAVGKGHLWIAENQNQGLKQDGKVEPLFPNGDFQLTIKNPDRQQDGAFITIDPAGTNKRSDATAIGGHIVYEQGRTIELAELEGARLNPMETIKRALLVAERLSAPVIFVEAAAYQASLCFWAEQVLEQLGLQGVYQFLPVTSGNVAKLARIRDWVGELLGGSYTISDIAVKEQILYQGLLFDVQRTDNDDNLLDAAAYGTVIRNRFMPIVLELFGRFSSLPHSQPTEHTTRSGLGTCLQLLY